jgi:SecD/SecF fusion protein
MQNKGAIKLFAILLGLTCIYYLSFTWVTRSVEKDADEYAAEYVGRADVQARAKNISNDTLLQRVYLDSVHGAVLDSFLRDMRTKTVYDLGLTSFTYEECKGKEINLGLDLRGGMNVTLEVSVAEIIRGMADNNPDQKFNVALTKAAENQKTSNKDFITLFGEAYNELDKSPTGLARIFGTRELKDEISRDATNDQVLKVIREKVDDAINTAETTLRARIDKFGVTQPNIQKLQTAGRILVELPGVKDKERVRKLLQGTANLEFWETYGLPEVIGELEAANKVLAALNKTAGDTAVTTAADTAKQDTATVAQNKPDTSKTAIDTTRKTLASQLGKDTSIKSGNVMTREDSIAQYRKENPLFSILQVSLMQNEQGQQTLATGPIIGYANVKDTGTINKYLKDQRVKKVLPRDARFMWAVKPMKDAPDGIQLYAIKVTSKDGSAALSGDVISDARTVLDQTQGGNASISMEMTPQAGQEWKRLTGANVGKSIAIVLDNYVYSAPTVQDEIAGGSSSITGDFTIREADDVVNVLKAGKLPAPAHIVEETVVGPTLGQEAIRSGLLSFVISLILVLIFMAIYYSKAGLVADIALFCNVFFVMGVLASLGAVLTLPGIAGIVLTIGLSVDANILIFERVREELALGKGLPLAIKDGFRHAMSSIIDSNITTLLLGIILYVFGTGPIQGFATTLIIGILTSLFCAIFITRLIFEYMLKKNQSISFSTTATARVFKNININFVQKRKLYYAFSGLIILAGVITYVAKGGFNLGVDFKGGRTYVVRFDQPQDMDQLRSTLTASFGHPPEVKTYGGTNQLKVTTTYLIDDLSEDAQAKADAKLKEGLAELGSGYTIQQSNMVNPMMSQDIKAKSIWAVAFSCLVMFVFIFIRFKKWQYGLGAVVALVHDVLIILACFVMLDGLLPFSLEIDQHFIAAILTVMGYSMTDTVVVFDRIREYLTEKNKKDLFGSEQRRVINEALNNTLSRTVITSLTIFLVLLAIFIFGGTTIKGFTFALLIGIVIGTYSSICIATPVVIDLDRREEEGKTPQPALK